MIRTQIADRRLRPARVRSSGGGTLYLSRPVVIEEGQRYWVDRRRSQLVVEDERGHRRSYAGTYRLGRTEGAVLLRWTFIAVSLVAPWLPVWAPTVPVWSPVGRFYEQEYPSAVGTLVVIWALLSIPSLLAANSVRRPEFPMVVGLGTLAYLATFPFALVYVPSFAVLLPLWAAVLVASVVGRLALTRTAAKGRP